MKNIVKSIYIIIILYSLVVGSVIVNTKRGTLGWYGHEVTFSDWRGASKVDYSCNKLVANYYSHGSARYFRNENFNEIQRRIVKGDTIRIGLDYYDLTGLSLINIMPIKVTEPVIKTLLDGGVLILDWSE